MSVAQCQQLYELRKRARFIKGKKTSESSRALEARVAALEAKQTTVMRAFLQSLISLSLVTEITQP